MNVITTAQSVDAPCTQWQAALHESGHVVTALACGGIVERAWITQNRETRQWGGRARTYPPWRLNQPASHAPDLCDLLAGGLANIMDGDDPAIVHHLDRYELGRARNRAQFLADATGVGTDAVMAWGDALTRRILTANKVPLHTFARFLERRFEARNVNKTKNRTLQGLVEFDAVTEFERHFGARLPASRSKRSRDMLDYAGYVARDDADDALAKQMGLR